jgi:tetratricopeptide (TPR) repeat protein
VQRLALQVAEFARSEASEEQILQLQLNLASLIAARTFSCQPGTVEEVIAPCVALHTLSDAWRFAARPALAAALQDPLGRFAGVRTSKLQTVLSASPVSLSALSPAVRRLALELLVCYAASVAAASTALQGGIGREDAQGFANSLLHEGQRALRLLLQATSVQDSDQRLRVRYLAHVLNLEGALHEGDGADQVWRPQEDGRVADALGAAMYLSAFRAFQRGGWAEAVSLWRRCVAGNYRTASSLLMIGCTHVHDGTASPEVAAKCFNQALACDDAGEPLDAAFNCALALCAARQFSAAHSVLSLMATKAQDDERSSQRVPWRLYLVAPRPAISRSAVLALQGLALSAEAQWSRAIAVFEELFSTAADEARASQRPSRLLAAALRDFAFSLLAVGDDRRAASLCSRLLDVLPSDPIALVYRADALVGQASTAREPLELWRRALADLDAAIASLEENGRADKVADPSLGAKRPRTQPVPEPVLVTALVNRAALLWKLERGAEAIESAERAVLLAPQHDAANATFASLLWSAGLSERAAVTWLHFRGIPLDALPQRITELLSRAEARAEALSREVPQQSLVRRDPNVAQVDLADLDRRALRLWSEIQANRQLTAALSEVQRLLRG